MNHITIIVNVTQPKPQGDSFWVPLAKQLAKGIENRVRIEKACGEPEFVALKENYTHSEFLAASDAYDLRKRKEERKAKGFWRYYFGS